MTLKDRIVKLWYELPRFQFKISFKKYHLDSRAFEWYLFRKKYGFDETELWNLGPNFFNRLSKKYNIDENNKSAYNEVFKREEFKEDAQWIYDRVKVYYEHNCPIFIPELLKDSPEKADEKKKNIINKLLLIFKHRADGNTIVDAEINYVVKYISFFGW